MHNTKKKKQTFKIKNIIIILIITLIIIGSIIAINQYNKPKNQSTEQMKGVFYFDENIKYEFQGNGQGTMYDREEKYKYTYVIDGEKITLYFKNKKVHDATYKFKLENDELTLIGKEGTTGGQYILKRERK